MIKINNQKDISKEEYINVVTHFPGIIMGVVFSAILMIRFRDSGVDHLLSYLVYGITFVMIFTASTCYHNAKTQKAKELLKKVDHSCIYLFMAGCYTPFVIINMQGPLKYPFLAFVWIMAIVGVFYKFFSKYKGPKLSLALYLSFAYMAFIFKDDLIDKMPDISFQMLLTGGIFYTVGIIFYAIKKIPYHHGLWHIFVLLGAIFQFFALYKNH